MDTTRRSPKGEFRMSEPTETPEAPAGLPAQEPISGIPEPTPAEPEGHVGVESPTETPAPAVPDTPAPVEKEEPAFFDRKEWEERLGKIEDPAAVTDLRNLEKMLLGQWTQKNQALAGTRQKVEAYDAFMDGVQRDPQGTMVALQQQLGLSPMQAAAVVEDASGGPKEYSDWSEVFADIKQEVMTDMRREFAPAMASVHKMTTQQVEGQLDAIDPDWRLYEDNIAATMRQHPTLANDLPALFRHSVPMEVQEQRATKAALQKLEKQTKAAAPATPAPVRTKGSPTKVSSFQEAYEQAKRDLG